MHELHFLLNRPASVLLSHRPPTFPSCCCAWALTVNLLGVFASLGSDRSCKERVRLIWEVPDRAVHVIVAIALSLLGAVARPEVHKASKNTK